MAKAHRSSVNILYFIGAVLILLGLLLPILKAGPFKATGLKMLTSGKPIYTISAVLIFGGAVFGLLSCIIGALSHYDLVALIISIAGGAVLALNYGTDILKFLSHFVGSGFYLVIIGWVMALFSKFVRL